MGYYKIIQSGDLIEYYKYEKRKDSITKREYARKKTDHQRYLRSLTRRSDNLLRSRKYFRRLVRSNLSGTELPSLLTLTMHEILSIQQSNKALTKFLLRLQQRLGFTKYIGVIEFQKRGACHYHILLWGLPDTVICRGHYEYRNGKKIFYCDKTTSCECSSRIIQRLWLRGWCDCVETDGHAKLSTYLTKYLSKAMRDSRLCSKKAYFTSHNVLRPVSLGFTEALEGVVEEHIIGDSQLLQEKNFHTEWLGTCNYKLYSKNFEYDV